MIGTYESITIFTRLAYKVRDSLRYLVCVCVCVCVCVGGGGGVSTGLQSQRFMALFRRGGGGGGKFLISKTT